MKYLVALLIGISLGFFSYPQLVFIRLNCDITRYGSQWEPLSGFESFKCLNEPIEAAIETRPDMVIKLIRLKLGLK